MQKIILGLVLLTVMFALTSCEKNNINPLEANFAAVAAAEGGIVFLASSNYERVEREALERDGEKGGYVGGILDYMEAGDVSVTVDFNCEKEGSAYVTEKDGEKTEVDFEKDWDEWDKEDWDDKDKDAWDKDKEDWDKDKEGDKDYYEKVVVEPLVKTADCDYIVAGSIEFFYEDEWVATIDFGDGTCDDLAVKTTAEGDTEFSLDDWK